MTNKKYPLPDKEPCLNGKKGHSISIWSGICSICGKQFWEPDKEELEDVKKILRAIK